MSHQSHVAARVKKIIGEHLGVAYLEITPEKALVADLGAESLDMVELIMGVEDEFCIEISDKAAEKIRTVQDVVDTVVRLMPAPITV